MKPITTDEVIEDMISFRYHLEKYDDSSISSPRIIQIAKMRQWIGMLKEIRDREKFQAKSDKSDCKFEIFVHDTKCIEIKFKDEE